MKNKYSRFATILLLLVFSFFASPASAEETEVMDIEKASTTASAPDQYELCANCMRAEKERCQTKCPERISPTAFICLRDCATEGCQSICSKLRKARDRDQIVESLFQGMGNTIEELTK
jgi:hypothetical protein